MGSTWRSTSGMRSRRASPISVRVSRLDAEDLRMAETRRATAAAARNVYGEPLAECSAKPLTGFYRTGSCATGPDDFGLHTVCTRVDADFLAFSRAAGNDLSTPVPQAGFPGLKPGDCWCLC